MKPRITGRLHVMHKGLRVLLASTAALVSLPAFAWLAAELAAYYEMFSTAMNSRAELGEDLGFGILLFMVVPPFTLAGAAFIWWFVWSLSGRSKAPSQTGIAMHNFPPQPAVKKLRLHVGPASE